MTNLLKIPYFQTLADKEGADWLADVFSTLDVEDFDFNTVPYLKTAIDGMDTESLQGAPMDGMPAASGESAAPAHSGSAQEPTLDFANAPFDWDSIEQGSMDTPRYFQILSYALEHHYDNIGTARSDLVAMNGDMPYMDLGAGDDKIYVASKREFHSNYSESTIDGGAGTDTVYLTRPDIGEVSQDGFTVTLGESNNFGEHGGQVVLLNIENVVGSAGDDTITGDDRANDLSGGDGKDKLLGGDGNDTLSGDGGDDTLTGGSGDDILSGGSGTDNLTGGADDDALSGGDGDDTLNGDGGVDDLSGGNGDDKLNGGAGNDSLSGNAGNDQLDGGDGSDGIDGGAGNDKILGSSGVDTITGGDGNDTIDGGTGNDKIDGNDGTDTIKGGFGADTIDAGAGDDSITGGAGVDTITGGAGKDTFIYTLLTDSLDGSAGRDVIMDFDVANDVFDFKALPSDPDGLSSVLSFVNSAAFNSVKGEVRFEKFDLAGTANDTTLIQIDDNGDGHADFEVELKGLHDLTSANFHLT